MRALILSIGGLRGAYEAGVASALCRKLGSKYFDAIYMSSVGSFNGTFYAANQPDVIEDVWRNYVSGNQLVNYFNPFKGRAILDLEYLIDLFQSEKLRLNLDEIFNSGIKLHYVVENLKTGLPKYIEPTRENIFDLLRASSAVPIIHGPVALNGIKYVDGSLVDPLPFKRALEDGYNELVLIYNKPKGFFVGRAYKIFVRIFSLFVPKAIGRRMLNLEHLYKNIEKELESNNNIMVIRPNFPLHFLMLERNKKKINQAFNAGLKDGYKAAEKILRLKN